MLYLKNSYVFKNAKQLILNKAKVSEYIQSQLQNLSEEEQNKRVLKFINTKKGLPYFEDSDGNYWNLSLFIEGSKTFEKVENADIAYEGGKLFGDFLNLTEGIDTNEIVDILPNFHEMSFRYHQFYEALENASAERLLLAEKYIQQVLGTFLYYARMVDGTMLTVLSATVSEKTTPTKNVRLFIDVVRRHFS